MQRCKQLNHSFFMLRYPQVYFSNHKSIILQLMAWYGQATFHYLKQCWQCSIAVYDVIERQWVKPNHDHYNLLLFIQLKRDNRILLPDLWRIVIFDIILYMAFISIQTGLYSRIVSHLDMALSSTTNQLFLYHINVMGVILSSYDDVIKWKHVPRYWSFVSGIHRWVPLTKASDAELWCLL